MPVERGRRRGTRERPDRIRASSRPADRPADRCLDHGGRGYAGKLSRAVKLRLYHHPDGARIAYREAGTGPPLALLHSKGLTHREFEPVVDALAHRHRVVLPDLPLHGASEDRPTHPYSPEWLTELLAGFLARHLRAAAAGRRPRRRRAARAARGRRAARCSRPSSSCCRTRCTPSPPRSGLEKAGSVAVRARGRPGLRPAARARRRARAAPEPRRPADRHRRPRRARPRAPRADRPRRQRQPRPLVGQGRAALAARRAEGPARRLRGGWTSRCCCCGPTRTRRTRWRSPRRRSTCSRTPQLRVLPRTGFLIAYDDPVGVARELVAFCG